MPISYYLQNYRNLKLWNLYQIYSLQIPVDNVTFLHKFLTTKIKILFLKFLDKKESILSKHSILYFVMHLI